MMYELDDTEFLDNTPPGHDIETMLPDGIRKDRDLVRRLIHELQGVYQCSDMSFDTNAAMLRVLDGTDLPDDDRESLEALISALFDQIKEVGP